MGYGTHPYQGVQAQPIDEELDKTLRVLQSSFTEDLFAIKERKIAAA
jgi:hypothetical protein